MDVEQFQFVPVQFEMEKAFPLGALSSILGTNS